MELVNVTEAGQLDWSDFQWTQTLQLQRVYLVKT